MTATEKFFAKARYPMVFLFPGAIVCALAGQTGMAPAGFLVTNIAGTLTSIFMVRAFSATIASPVEALLGFFNRNLVATTAVSAALVALSLVLNRVQGGMESIDELEAELEQHEDDAPEPTSPS